MNIAFLNPQGNFDPTDFGWTEHPDFGGQLVYVKELALAIGDLGHRVDIITRKFNDPKWSKFNAERDSYPDHHNVRILRFKCGPDRFLPKEQLWPFLFEWTNNILEYYQSQESAPDALTAHYGDGGLAAVLLQQKQDLPFTFTGHSLGAQKMDKFIRSRKDFGVMVNRYQFAKRIASERVSMNRASRIITSTNQERFQQYGHRLYHNAVDPNQDEKFAIIPPGVNLRIFGFEQKKQDEEKIARKVEHMLTRDIPAERCDLPVAICSSRLDEKKNHLALVKAWTVSERLRDAANLAIIVRGVENPLKTWKTFLQDSEARVFRQLMEVIEEYHLQKCVTAFDLNNQNELAACYRHLGKNRNGIFVLTSVYEPFGLAPLEAMAAGLPAVVTQNGGPSESLMDEQQQYAILVDPHDPKDIADGIVRLALNKKNWKKFQALGLKRVSEKYTWERTAIGYLKEIEQILSGNDARQNSIQPDQYFINPEKNEIEKDWLEKLYFGQ